MAGRADGGHARRRDRKTKVTPGVRRAQGTAQRLLTSDADRRPFSGRSALAAVESFAQTTIAVDGAFRELRSRAKIEGLAVRAIAARADVGVRGRHARQAGRLHRTGCGVERVQVLTVDAGEI